MFQEVSRVRKSLDKRKKKKQSNPQAKLPEKQAKFSTFSYLLQTKECVFPKNQVSSFEAASITLLPLIVDPRPTTTYT